MNRTDAPLQGRVISAADWPDLIPPAVDPDPLDDRQAPRTDAPADGEEAEASTPIPAASAEAAELARLTGMLTRTATVDDVLVVIEPGLEDAAVSYTDPCTGVRRIGLGTGLLNGPAARLHGALAHEVAHHALGHTHGSARGRDVRIVIALTMGAVLAGAPGWLMVLGLAAGVVLTLLERRDERREEIAADVYSVRLLDGAGLPGHSIVTTTLAEAPADPWWYRAGGWITGTHPTLRARRRAVATAS
ncbi:M48 family metalloprotease [Streptosporangium carneum]|uniref:Peptidase M48 domain-containing protein n=1 Tax=Streptosporangium carneum TaxID=47481 RepID=A0A9W6HWK7_9ACTN|nr:M48 family metalloprotease [Streptosporangium carneum]GLK06740.1 hypothetical protein GCM10017600_01450 [Streptosporangium carneum]